MLDRAGYQQWSMAMQSFLMSQGQWKCTKEGAEAPNTTTTVTEVEGGPSVSVTAGKEKVASWNEDAEKALGNIHLRLHHTIGYQFNDVTNPSTLWETLKAKYGSVGLTHALIKFKAIMDTTILNGVDPSPALDKIISHYVRLNNMDCEIPKKILLMMLLAKAPLSMEMIVQMFSQILGDAGAAKVESELVPEKIVHMMRTSWETHGRAGMSQNNQQ